MSETTSKMTLLLRSDRRVTIPFKSSTDVREVVKLHKSVIVLSGIRKLLPSISYPGKALRRFPSPVKVPASVLLPYLTGLDFLHRDNGVGCNTSSLADGTTSPLVVAWPRVGLGGPRPP